MNDTHDSKFCTDDRVANTLVLMDADGEVLATHEIAQRKGGRREAKSTVNRWLQTYSFDFAAAMNLI